MSVVNAIYDIVEKAKKYDEIAFINNTKEVCCSFCGKRQSEVEKIIASTDVTICNKCVEVCTEIIQVEREGDETS